MACIFPELLEVVRGVFLLSPFSTSGRGLLTMNAAVMLRVMISDECSECCRCC